MSVNAEIFEPTNGIEIYPEGATILVVEDDAADSQLVAHALRRQPRVGRVEFARDGVEALELLGSNGIVPDLAIIDLKMPRMDGFRLLIELSVRAEQKFPIVVLTSSRARSDAVRSLFRGADRVLVKPNSFDELEDILDEVIRGL